MNRSIWGQKINFLKKVAGGRERMDGGMDKGEMFSPTSGKFMKIVVRRGIDRSWELSRFGMGGRDRKNDQDDIPENDELKTQRGFFWSGFREYDSWAKLKIENKKQANRNCFTKK